MCDFIDQQLGEFLTALDSMGERENTLLVFTSDHGEMLGDHGIYLKGPYFYDPVTRVPFIIQGPGVVAQGNVDALVELVDLAPTILEACGVEAHPGMQGKSLWSILRGDTKQHRQRVYCEYLDAMPFHQSPPAYGTMIRTSTHKLCVDHSHRQGELYDLNQDPGETTNLWNSPDHASVKMELMMELNHAQVETVDPLPRRIAPW